MSFDFSDATDAQYRELKAAHVEAARLKPATATRQQIDAELRHESDRELESRVAYDCPDSSMPWEKMALDQKKAWRARNEVARRANASARQADADATNATAAAGAQAVADATRAALRSKLATPGLTGAALESAIDAVLTTKAIAGVDALLEQKRRAYGGL